MGRIAIKRSPSHYTDILLVIFNCIKLGTLFALKVLLSLTGLLLSCSEIIVAQSADFILKRWMVIFFITNVPNKKNLLE